MELDAVHGTLLVPMAVTIAEEMRRPSEPVTMPERFSALPAVRVQVTTDKTVTANLEYFISAHTSGADNNVFCVFAARNGVAGFSS